MMTLAICAVSLLLAVLSLFVFHEGSFMTFVMLALSAAGLLVASPLFKPMNAKGRKILGAVLAVLAMLSSLYAAPFKLKTNSTYDKARELYAAENKILSLDADAEKTLAAYEETWGESDSSFGLHAYQSMIAGNRDEAYSWMSRYSDRSSQDYYLRMEALYLMDPEKTDPRDLYQLYERAASEHLKWEYMQKCAGMACFEQKKYINAEFYLNNALAQNPDDPVTLYYLGAVYCMRGKIQEAEDCFRTSIANGAGDEMKSWMIWYMDEAAGKGEKQ